MDEGFMIRFRYTPSSHFQYVDDGYHAGYVSSYRKDWEKQNDEFIFKTFDEAMEFVDLLKVTPRIGRNNTYYIYRLGPKVCHEGHNRLVWTDDKELKLSSGYGDLPPRSV